MVPGLVIIGLSVLGYFVFLTMKSQREAQAFEDFAVKETCLACDSADVSVDETTDAVRCFACSYRSDITDELPSRTALVDVLRDVKLAESELKPQTSLTFMAGNPVAKGAVRQEEAADRLRQLDGARERVARARDRLDAAWKAAWPERAGSEAYEELRSRLQAVAEALQKAQSGPEPAAMKSMAKELHEVALKLGARIMEDGAD